MTAFRFPILTGQRWLFSDSCHCHSVCSIYINDLWCIRFYQRWNVSAKVNFNHLSTVITTLKLSIRTKFLRNLILKNVTSYYWKTLLIKYSTLGNGCGMWEKFLFTKNVEILWRLNNKPNQVLTVVITHMITLIV